MGVGMVKVKVDLTGCGFSNRPHVTTMLSAVNGNVQAKGGSTGIRKLSSKGFDLNIWRDEITPKIANKEWKYELYWTATDYGC